MPLLTIAIPTYNRETFLREKLAIFINDTHEDIEFVVIDNNSNYDKSFLTSNDIASKKNIKYISNNLNIGGPANVLRCFENATGDWIWILGDDDALAPNAIEIVYQECQKAVNYSFINFGSTLLDLGGVKRRQNISTDGISEFIENIDNFSNLLFISAGIYKTKEIIKFLRCGYHNINTFAPHTAMLFELLQCGENRKVLFSNKHIIEWKPAEESQQWEYEVVNIGLQKLTHQIQRLEDRSIFMNILIKEKTHTPFPKTLKRLILLFGAKNNNAEELFIINIIMLALLRKNWSFLALSLYFTFYDSVLNKTAEKIIFYYNKITNKKLILKKSTQSIFNESKRL